MKKKIFNGILLRSTSSIWWGILGVFYFKLVSFAGPIELVVHRILWTAVVLFLSISFYSRWKYFFLILKNKKKMITLFICAILICTNWSVWIYAVVTNNLIDASFGYYIFPILSVFFGYIFLKEKLNQRRILSIILVAISVIYLLLSLENIPFIGLTVAFSWSIYNLLRKMINVKTDIGLLIETIFILPVALFSFYLITQKGLNDFAFSNPKLMLLLFLAGPMTVIPLYLYVRGVELAGLGPTGMIFFITPTCHFLLRIFYYNEIFNITKLIGFILIWIAVIIYLRDLNKKT